MRPLEVINVQVDCGGGCVYDVPEQAILPRGIDPLSLSGWTPFLHWIREREVKPQCHGDQSAGGMTQIRV